MVPVNRSMNYTKIKDLPVYDLNKPINDDGYVLIVLDLDYNPKFEK